MDTLKQYILECDIDIKGNREFVETLYGMTFESVDCLVDLLKKQGLEYNTLRTKVKYDIWTLEEYMTKLNDESYPIGSWTTMVYINEK